MNQGKRGMSLEKMIEDTNQIYRQRGWAMVHKIATPWTVNYDKGTKKVKSAFPGKKSSIDFQGTVKGGRAIALEAKSTKNKTSYPLNQIEKHQLDYLLDFNQIGGLGYFVLQFETFDERYLLPSSFVEEYWIQKDLGGRQSIEYQEIQKSGHLIPSIRGVSVDYLYTITNILRRKN